MTPVPLALVHDYLTQEGGAERVVLTLATAYPSAPVYTSLYDPAGTFPGFTDHEVRTLPLDRVGLLRNHHRLALPLLAPSFSRMHVDADVAICSSSGWAHGAQVTGRKIVYCHNPARWLYQRDKYLDGSSGLAAMGLGALAPALRRWDGRAAATADRYLVNSRAVRDRVEHVYGIEAEVVPPPVDVDVSGPTRAPAEIEPGFLLCVSRLLPYKNVDVVCAAMRSLPHLRLVVVGSGPQAEQLASQAPANVTLLGRVDDAGLRWLYSACHGLVAASWEDFGLTPVEAAAFGKPTAALRWGGFLDTIEEGRTGVLFDAPEPTQVADGIDELVRGDWPAERLINHADQFSVDRFLAEITRVVAEERMKA